MNLPPFSPLLFSLLPCVKLYSTCQFNHAHTQTFSSLAPKFLSHLTYQLYFLIDISYMDVLGIQIQKLSKLNLSTLSQDLLLLLYLISQWVTSKIIPLAQPRNPGAHLIPPSLRNSHMGHQNQWKKKTQKQSIRKSEALANVHCST